MYNSVQIFEVWYLLNFVVFRTFFHIMEDLQCTWLIQCISKKISHGYVVCLSSFHLDNRSGSRPHISEGCERTPQTVISIFFFNHYANMQLKFFNYVAGYASPLFEYKRCTDCTLVMLLHRHCSFDFAPTCSPARLRRRRRVDLRGALRDRRRHSL